MTNSNCGMKGFLLGFLAGTTLGAATALLMTPQSGKDTRELIENKATDAKEVLSQKAHTLQEAASTRLQEAKASAADMMSKAKGVVEEYVPHSMRVKLAKDVSQKIEDGLVHLAEK